MSGSGRGTPTTSPTRWNSRASSWASSHSAGSGHVRLACRARRQYSDTVPRPTPQARAIARWGRRCSYFSRRISRTCLISSLSVMSVGTLLPRGPPYRAGRATDERSRSESAITIPGMGDHDAPESAIRIDRNERSGSAGTGDQDGPEPAVAVETQSGPPRLHCSRRDSADRGKAIRSST